MKRFYRPVLTVFLVALAAACVWVSVRPHRVVAAAQPSMQMQMTHAHITPGIIDGRVHPELIPDSAAYRLFFIVASQGGLSPTPQQITRQKAVLFSAGVRTPIEMRKALPILERFSAQYTALVTNYNTSWYVTHNSTAGLARFLADRNSLVQSTRDQLKAVLAPNTMTTFDRHVQSEKVHMKVAEAEAQQ